MKKYIKTLFIAAMTLMGVSCQEDQIDLYCGEHFLHFTQKSEEVYNFSFAVHPGVQEFEYKVPLKLIGSAYPEDKEYKVVIVDEGEFASTLSQSLYELPEQTLFSKGVWDDTLRIHLLNGEELQESQKLTLKIAENNHFKPGPEEFQIAQLVVTNKLSQPEWWGKYENIYLGPYSDIKYQTFILATGISDLSDKNQFQVNAYVKDFVSYLRMMENKGTPVYEEDGVTTVISSVPFNKSN